MLDESSDMGKSENIMQNWFRHVRKDFQFSIRRLGFGGVAWFTLKFANLHPEACWLEDLTVGRENCVKNLKKVGSVNIWQCKVQELGSVRSRNSRNPVKVH